MQSSVNETGSASWPARTARIASAAISRARSMPTRLGLQPGPVCLAATAPDGSTRMHSVFVPPPSTPIFQAMGSGPSGELAAEPAPVARTPAPGCARSRPGVFWLRSTGSGWPFALSHSATASMSQLRMEQPTRVEVGPALSPPPTSTSASPGTPQLSRTWSATSRSLLPEGCCEGAAVDMATQVRAATVRPFALA